MKFVLQYLRQSPENHNIFTHTGVYVSETCRNTARSAVLVKNKLF